MQQNPLDELCNQIAACKLFERERVPHRLKAEAILAYSRGMSFRSVAAQFHWAFSPESVRRWWHATGKLFQVPRGRHDIIAADETWFHRGKRSRKVVVKRRLGKRKGVRIRREIRRLPATHLIWVGINAKTLAVVNLQLGTRTTNADCYQFLSRTKERSGSEPHIVHDRGPWYKSQCEAVGLSHEQMRGGLRSSIECWNRQLKHRIDQFWRAFPPSTSEDTMRSWLAAYCVCWNLTRT